MDAAGVDVDGVVGLSGAIDGVWPQARLAGAADGTHHQVGIVPSGSGDRIIAGARLAWRGPMAKLPTGEVFPNPTVDKVIFQIRFPSLFFLENRVGDFQLEIITRFPESELRLQRSVVFAHGADPDVIAKQLPDTDSTTRIWVFSNPAGVVVELKNDSLTIMTRRHKSYKTGEECFRDVVAFVLERLRKVVPIPVATRLGLRYTDRCPVPEFTTAKVTEYYNSTLPLARFPVEGIQGEMTTRVVTAVGTNRRLQYIERLQPPDSEGEARLILDFDASAENLKPDEIMGVTDELHAVIRTAFESTIKEPVVEWMRAQPGEAQ